jgi:hypothetical protein
MLASPPNFHQARADTEYRAKFILTYLCPVMHHLNQALGISIGGGVLREQVQPKRYTLLGGLGGVRTKKAMIEIEGMTLHNARIFEVSN